MVRPVRHKSFRQAVNRALDASTLAPLFGTSLVITIWLIHSITIFTFSLAVWRIQEDRAIRYWVMGALLAACLGAIARVLATRNSGPFLPRTLVLVAILSEILISGFWIIGVFRFVPVSEMNTMIVFMIIIASAAFATSLPQHHALMFSFSALGLALPLLAIRLLQINAVILGPHALSLTVLWLGLIMIILYLNRAAKARLEWHNTRDNLIGRIEEKAHLLALAREAETRARREAEEANASKSQFLAHSSHDLRQPLHACGLLLETLNLDLQDQRSKEVIGRVKQSLEFLSKLFDSLLDMTMLDTGRIEVNKQAFALNDAFDQMRQDFQPLAELCDVELRIQPTSFWVKTDPLILRRMVQNLVSNAIQHAKGRAVLVGARRKSGKISIEIHDKGIGIAREDQARIFQEFTKIHQDHVTVTPQGLGLGLAIVQRMAIILGLSVDLRSEAGKGSIFSIEDLKPVQSQATDANKRPHSPTAPTGQHVVIVDDDKDTLAATAALLAKWGYQTSVYETGNVSHDPQAIDVMVCDYELAAKENGLSVIRRMRKLAKRAIPAILITGNTDATIEKKAATLQVPVLYKPVRAAQLRSALLVACSPHEKQL